MSRAVGIASLVLLIAGCATVPAPQTTWSEPRIGVVQSIDQVAPRPGSALTGILVGGVLGTASTDTENRDVGIALGALGGAWAIRNSSAGAAEPGFLVTVRMDDGAVGRFERRDLADISVGQRVAVNGNRLAPARIAVQ